MARSRAAGEQQDKERSCSARHCTGCARFLSRGGRREGARGAPRCDFTIDQPRSLFGLHAPARPRPAGVPGACPPCSLLPPPSNSAGRPAPRQLVQVRLLGAPVQQAAHVGAAAPVRRADRKGVPARRRGGRAGRPPAGAAAALRCAAAAAPSAAAASAPLPPPPPVQLLGLGLADAAVGVGLEVGHRARLALQRAARRPQQQHARALAARCARGQQGRRAPPRRPPAPGRPPPARR
jgi:hypothetical protein